MISVVTVMATIRGGITSVCSICDKSKSRHNLLLCCDEWDLLPVTAYCDLRMNRREKERRGGRGKRKREREMMRGGRGRKTRERTAGRCKGGHTNKSTSMVVDLERREGSLVDNL